MKTTVIIFLIALSTQELSSRQIFENITNKAGITGLGLTNSVSFNDHNNDGKPDLYIVHQTGSELYKNNGQTFMSVTNTTSLPPGQSLLVGIMGDYDNDGDLDIFAGGESQGYKCYLFRNDSVDQFTDISNIAGIGAMTARVFAATWLDFDNDGNLDLFLGTIAPTSSNIFFKNLGNKTFANLTRETDLSFFSSYTRGLAAGDYDRDGDLDIFVSNTDFNRNYFFRNDGNLFSEVASSSGVEFRSDKTHSAELW
jgi:hypothetical protein